MLLLLRFLRFFLKIQKRDFLRFLLCFTRFLELWREPEYDAKIFRFAGSSTIKPVSRSNAIHETRVMTQHHRNVAKIHALLTKIERWGREQNFGQAKGQNHGEQCELVFTIQGIRTSSVSHAQLYPYARQLYCSIVGVVSCWCSRDAMIKERSQVKWNTQ